MTGKSKTVEEYISSKAEVVRKRLEELRHYLQLGDPDAVDELKWGKPALVNDGILFVYAGFNKHISLHPTPSVINALRDELGAFKLSENTIQFPIDGPIPEKLVIKIAKLRVFEKHKKGIDWK